MIDLRNQLSHWRRDFHAYPELGFCEFRTVAKICDVLSRLEGCTVRVGAEVMEPGARMGVPAPEELARAREDALAQGGDPQWIKRLGDGLTAVVAEWTFPRPGPTLAFRVDIDALPIVES